MITEQQKANRKLWIEDLRSGLPQTRGTLHRTEMTSGLPVGYCCLGVACKRFNRNVTKLLHVVRYDFMVSQLSEYAAEQLGLKAQNPKVKLSSSMLDKLGINDLRPGGFHLSDLNDIHKLTLEQIADIIESQSEDWNGL